MALLFSAVTVTAGYDEAEFTVGGIPREYDDLVGWTAFDDFMENVDAETGVSVHAEVYFYDEVPQTELARKYGINQSNISRKIGKILLKIKKLMEI